MMGIASTAADRAALCRSAANDALHAYVLARKEATMRNPDRSRRDDDVAQSLSILAAAGNAALIERNYTLTEENRALLAQNESLLDGAARRQGYVEEIEARVAALTATVHAQACEIAALRRGLDVLCARLWGRV